jgi:hypothetical protein
VMIGGDTHTDTQGFMKYTVEMGSGAMIYKPSFIKTGSCIQKLIWDVHIQLHTSHKPTIIFSRQGN